MSLACETEIGVQNELSLRFAIVSKPTPVLEYIKTISSLVGASHILAVFEEDDTLKVFFDDKRFVDTFIRSGIHVVGHHVRADYVVPPGTKVTVSNIDPIVNNFDLKRLLSMYGTVVSPIICPPVCDDMEYCHISYGVRYCYMTIIEPIPNKLEFKYGDQLCVVKIRVSDEGTLLPFIKSDESDLTQVEQANNCVPEPSIDDDNPVVVSVESTALESNTEVRLGAAKLPIKRNQMGRKGRSRRPLKIKRTAVTATTRAAKKIKNNVKHNWIRGRGKQMKPLRKGKKRGRKQIRILQESSPPPKLLSLSPTTSDIDDLPPPLLLINETKTSSNSPLKERKLLEFIDECKHNRAPIELAKKYLESDSHELMLSLLHQLERHAKNSSCYSLKLRIGRLSKVLTEFVNGSKS